MPRDALLRHGRSRAEQGMRDTCVIRRHGDGQVDDNSGEMTGGTTQIYDGRCRLQARTVTAQDDTTGQDQQLLVRLELQLPIAAPEPQVGDEVEMTSAGNDPQIVGQTFRVRDLPTKSDATARRIGVIRRTS